MASKYTQSTYTRLAKDQDYMAKAMDSLTRMNFGQDANMEIVGDKVIINGGNIVSLDSYQRQAIDMQSDLQERPQLEKVYKDRQHRVEQAERYTRANPQVKSKDEIMQEQAYAQMRSNASNRVLASQKQQSKSLGLPSER